MKRGDAFQSNFVKTEDLQGREHQLIIDRVEMGEVMNQDTNKSEDKPVIFWRGKAKGMILNITNWDTLEEIYGDETDHWVGQPMTLYPTETRFGNRKVPCMRIRIPKGSEIKGDAPGHSGADLSQPPPPTPPADEPPPPSDDFDPGQTWEGDPF